MTTDDFGTLGLRPGASAGEVRTARRDLARIHHPDQGGDADRMRTINEAADRVLRTIAEATAPIPPADPTATPASAPASSETQDSEPTERWSGVERDAPSFTVEALPVETFEALLVVTSWIGEVLDDDPPYRLDVHLYEPTECWCRLDVVPDAGASTVSLSVAGVDGAATPDVITVRDAWVANLNQVDWT